MGLSGPIRAIAVSAQRAHPACEDCVHAGRFALQARVYCTDREAILFKRALYAWQPACERHVPRIGRDLTLHVHPRNEEAR